MASRGKGAPLLRSPARPTSRHAEESEAEQQRRMVQDKVSNINPKLANVPGQTWTGLDLTAVGLRSLSEKIGNFSHITILHLSRNHLTTLPVALFQRLRLLVTLDLSYNNLISLPSEIGELGKLETLYLFQNRLTELPLEFGRLWKLRTLTLDGNPLANPPQNIVQQGAERVVHYLRDLMPPPPSPPPRRWISIDYDGLRSLVSTERGKALDYEHKAKYLRPRDPSELSGKSLRIFCFNILAEAYATPERHGYCPAWALKWNEYRKPRVIKELLEHSSDIICLQEVEVSAYEDSLRPEMLAKGYKGYFKPKSRAHIAGIDRTKVDGCCIFYKANKLRLLDTHIVEFQQFALRRHEMFRSESGGSMSGYERLLSKDNISVFALLEFVDPKDEKSGQKQRFIVCNVHIHWDPEYCDVKMMQTQFLLEQAQSLQNDWRDKYHSKEDFPLIICGDFNSTPNSGVYELLQRGLVPGDHPEFFDYNYGEYTRKGLAHTFDSLGSCYGLHEEPEFTNYTADFV
eukprot:CAMPEP_0201490982 /NCGR_PEP_ID=MMETSP0151_2-20130828/28204_1 /ASSEMBLY_ACC=CAM_ASM_000257 /TAXON_ID=200890 /ORGANISM="Paramoeba atlantica, Strain 621/1 / CCAP 1560/9" /LENGTH=515 /DNA_ID=CAMNT_0047877159 /DNA_START=187 /DNA_END=1730 /DNA_ORIENTATION=-